MFYTSPNEARKVLHERQKNGVKKKVMDWFMERGYDLLFPTTIPDMAVLARYVATARYEDVVFKLMAENAGLTPFWMEYTGDKFVTCSSGKRSLLYPFMCDGRGKRGGFRLKKQRLANPHRWDGNPISSIVLDDGTPLVEWHHRRQDAIFGKVFRHDATPWFKRFDGAKEYYPFYLAFFVAHGVLFEDYHGGESGDRLDLFTTDVFEPAFSRVTEEIGYSPIIVPLPWWDGLQYYPENKDWQHHDVIDVAKLAA